MVKPNRVHLVSCKSNACLSREKVLIRIEDIHFISTFQSTFQTFWGEQVMESFDRNSAVLFAPQIKKHFSAYIINFSLPASITSCKNRPARQFSLRGENWWMLKSFLNRIFRFPHFQMFIMTSRMRWITPRHPSRKYQCLTSAQSGPKELKS